MSQLGYTAKVVVNEKLGDNGVSGAYFTLVAGLGWSSDWDGEDVGYPEVPVVGLYTWGALNFYINTENGQVLESWSDEVDGEDDDRSLDVQ